MNRAAKIKLAGTFYGAAAAACYGMNPLFALPLYHRGMGVNSVLFYRYVFALVLLFVWLKFFKKVSLKITKSELLPLFFMGITFSFSSLMLFQSYNYMDAGVASTILFIYPVLVAILMTVFFKEKLKIATVSSILLTTLGIFLLYHGKNSEKLSTAGVLLVFLSALSYALYIIGVREIKALRKINSSKLIFYVTLFGLIIYIYNLHFLRDLEILKTPFMWLDAVALALFPTIISLIAMTHSIKLIGPTPAAVLGALEPVSAVFFGVCVFQEQLTLRIIAGILTILAAVTIIILKQK